MVKWVSLRARYIKNVRKNEKELARVQKEQARIPLSGALPLPPTKRAWLARSQETLLRVRRAHHRGRQPLVGVLPGPGTLTFFVGVGMIAGEFLPVARLLDWAEVRVRKLGTWIREVWRLSVTGKALVLSVAAICVVAVLYVSYILLFAG